VQAASRLKLVLGWFLRKADMALDAFAKAVGDAAGKAVDAVAGVYVSAKLLRLFRRSLI
jgi:hypothetical protein